VSRGGLFERQQAGDTGGEQRGLSHMRSSS
jgi:hypothetical protein